MNDHPHTASPREDNRPPGAGRVRGSDKERAGDAAAAQHIPPAAHSAAHGQAHVRRWGCRAVRRGHRRGDHRQCQVRRPQEEFGLYREPVARHGNPASRARALGGRHPPARRPRPAPGEVVIAPARHPDPLQETPARVPRRGWRSTHATGPAELAADHRRWPARTLLAATRPGYARLERPALGASPARPAMTRAPSHSRITTRRKHK